MSRFGSSLSRVRAAFVGQFWHERPTKGDMSDTAHAELQLDARSAPTRQKTT
jgi:hypothetical protein